MLLLLLRRRLLRRRRRWRTPKTTTESTRRREVYIKTRHFVSYTYLCYRGHTQPPTPTHPDIYKDIYTHTHNLTKKYITSGINKAKTCFHFKIYWRQKYHSSGKEEMRQTIKLKTNSGGEELMFYAKPTTKAISCKTDCFKSQVGTKNSAIRRELNLGLPIFTALVTWASSCISKPYN